MPSLVSFIIKEKIMAELHVQPKRNSYWWVWLILALLIIGGAIYWYLNYYQKGTGTVVPARDSTAVTTPPTGDSVNLAMGQASAWDQVDFNSPDTTYLEMTDRNIKTQYNAHFVIYSLPGRSLFASGNSSLTAAGKQHLDQVGASINQRFNKAEVQVYDRSDRYAPGRLAVQRAESVSNYLVRNSQLDQCQVTVYQSGQASATAGHSDLVDIVVKR